jgi:hypothetical protein
LPIGRVSRQKARCPRKASGNWIVKREKFCPREIGDAGRDLYEARELVAPLPHVHSVVRLVRELRLRRQDYLNLGIGDDMNPEAMKEKRVSHIGGRNRHAGRVDQ